MAYVNNKMTTWHFYMPMNWVVSKLAVQKTVLLILWALVVS